MKKLSYALLLIIVTSFLITPSCFSQNLTINPSEAEGVLNNYFEYLKSGDTVGILNLLTGPFLKKRERLLRYNPMYGTFLKEKYEYAQFSIIGHRLIDNSKMTFDVQVALGDRDTLKRKFVIVDDKRILKIYSEEEIPASP